MKNFDKFIEEAKKQGTVFTIYGKTHYLPATIPAGTVFMIRKMGKLQSLDKDVEVAEEMFWDLFGSVFGRDNLGEWRKESTFSYELATEMLKEAMTHYGVNAPETKEDDGDSEDTEKKVITRNRKKA